MESNPRDYGEQCRFDAFCKKVLRNEARAYLRNMKRQREREAFFSDLSQAELDKLCVVDRYPSHSVVFSSHGYDLHIDNELVAEAFSALPQTEQRRRWRIRKPPGLFSRPAIKVSRSSCWTSSPSTAKSGGAFPCMTAKTP